MNLHCMVMAGGKGTRFWPLSRQIRSKQFLSLISNRPLIQQTIDRVSSWCPKERRWILGNITQKEYLMPLSSCVPSSQILQEPKGMNTAACIGWAAFEVLERDPNAVIVVLPSDQWVNDNALFQKTIALAAEDAFQNNVIVTIGIPPTEPHTGFGYIEVEPNNNPSKGVRRFVEKPDVNTAKKYISHGAFFWNAGIFICRADVMTSLFKAYLPRHYEVLSQSRKDILEEYHTLESISIDYGIMEKVPDLTRLIPAPFEWSDIGNWRAIEQFLTKDSHCNASKGSFVSVDSKNNIIYAEPGKLVALADVSDMIVVATHDAMLVIPKTSDQKIKEIYEKLPSEFQ